MSDNKNIRSDIRTKKNQFVVFGFCSLVALIVCMCILIFTANSVKNTESARVEFDSASKTVLKNEAESLSEYINYLTEETVGNTFVKVKTNTGIFIEDSTISISDISSEKNSDSDTEILKYVKNKVLPRVQSYYPEDIESVFGELYSQMPVLVFSEIHGLACNFAIGLTDESGKQIIDTDTGEVVDNEFYYITFDIPYNEILKNKNLLKYFSVDETKLVKEKFIKEVSSVCNVDDSKILPVKFIITAKINRFNDKIDNINFDSLYSVETTVNFIDKLEVFGSKRVAFEYKLSKSYEYSYAGISFSENLLILEPGDETALSVNAVIEDDSVYEVSFTSSDDSIATVDEMGYVKGIKRSDEPIVITVTLKYLDEVFTDDCKVFVDETKE